MLPQSYVIWRRHLAIFMLLLKGKVICIANNQFVYSNCYLPKPHFPWDGFPALLIGASGVPRRQKSKSWEWLVPSIRLLWHDDHHGLHVIFVCSLFHFPLLGFSYLPNDQHQGVNAVRLQGDENTRFPFFRALGQKSHNPTILILRAKYLICIGMLLG